MDPDIKAEVKNSYVNHNKVWPCNPLTQMRSLQLLLNQAICAGRKIEAAKEIMAHTHVSALSVIPSMSALAHNPKQACASATSSMTGVSVYASQAEKTLGQYSAGGEKLMPPPLYVEGRLHWIRRQPQLNRCDCT